MRVRFSGRIGSDMYVLVMLIMSVFMFMHGRHMCVLMLMVFRQMQP